MKNSLRYYREGKGLTQKELAERTGFKPQTVASYESYPRPLPSDFSEKAAKVLGVSEEELQSSPPGAQGDKAMVPIDILPVWLLGEILRVLSARLPNSSGAEQTRIVQSIVCVTDEIKQRPPEPPRERGRSSSTQVSQEDRTAIGLALDDVEGKPRELKSGHQSDEPIGETSPQAPSKPSGTKGKRP